MIEISRKSIFISSFATEPKKLHISTNNYLKYTDFINLKEKEFVLQFLNQYSSSENLRLSIKCTCKFCVESILNFLYSVLILGGLNF